MIVFLILISVLLSLFGYISIFQSKALLPDLYAHAAFPGVVFSYLLFGSQNLFGLTFGALLSVYLFRYVYELISVRTSFHSDSILACLIASSFSFGILLVNILQNIGLATNLIFSFLFGNISAVSQSELLFMSVFALLILLVLVYLRQFVCLFVFDRITCNLKFGFVSKIFELCYVFLLVLTIIFCLKISGVVLTTGLFLIPITIAAFRQTSARVIFYRLFLLLTLVSLVAYFISINFAGLSTGPVLVSIYFACFASQRVFYHLISNNGS